MPVTLKQHLEHRRRHASLWSRTGFTIDDVAIFALGSSGAYTLGFIGTVPICELFILALLPALLLQHGRLAFRREFRWFYILLLLWLFGTIINDIYLGVSPGDRMKGVARIVFFGMDFMTLAILINQRIRGMIAFAVSIVVVMCWYFVSFQAEFDTRWKFGGSSAVTISVLLISSYFYKNRRYWICAALACLIGVLNLKFAFRSQLAVDALSGLLILPIFASSSGLAPRPHSIFPDLRNFLAVLAFLGATAYLANKAVLYAAEHDFFDEATTAKFESQAAGKFGVLLGGRPETLVAIQAIRDSPIVGHGSFAVDPKYLKLQQDLSYENGYLETDWIPEEDNPGIPTHSHLTLAWVESGIAGGIFWIYILGVTSFGIFALWRVGHPMEPVFYYLLFNFIWDILYSPMGGVNRLWNAYTILICFYLIRRQKGLTPGPRGFLRRTPAIRRVRADFRIKTLPPRRPIRAS